MFCSFFQKWWNLLYKRFPLWELHAWELQLREIKDFNAWIDNKPIFDQSIKNKQEAYESFLKCQETKTVQQKIYWLTCIIKIITKSLA